MRTHISKRNDKMGRVWSVSLPAVTTCAPDVPCAKLCYAKRIERRFPKVASTYTDNLELLYTDRYTFFSSIVEEYNRAKVKPTLFRWFVSGDIPDSLFLLDARELALRLPDVRFLMFTKRFDYVKALEVDYMPKNFKIVLSNWGDRRAPYPLSQDYPMAVFIPKGGTIPSYATKFCDGNCDKCTYCFTMQPGQIVAFKQH